MKAAGVIFQDPRTRKVLLLRRAKGTGDHAGTWAFPGGRIEAGETAEEAAVRETWEEVGIQWPGDLEPWMRRVADGNEYTTFVARCAEFDPLMNAEHDARKWVTPEEAMELPLHPGARIALKRFLKS